MKDAVAIAKQAWRIACDRGPFLASVGCVIMGVGLLIRADRIDALAAQTPKPAKYRYETDAAIGRINAYSLLTVPVVVALMRIGIAQSRRRALDDDPFIDRF